MPLIQGKGKKAFKENIEKEMHAGKPQPQALAIAYSIKRKNSHKKMAQGGMINESAKTERRPMPEERDKDSAMVGRNSGNKPPKNDEWTSNVTTAQAQSKDSRRVMPIARPKMVPSNAFSTRMYDKEGRLQESASPGPYGAQPPKEDNEMGADRHGLDVPDMQDQHNNHRKPYAKGGRVDMEPMDSGIQMRERSNEAHLQSSEAPSEDEGLMDADSRNEMDQDRQGPMVPDMEREHNNGRKPYADGGQIDPKEDEEMSVIKPANISRPDGGYGAIISKAQGGMIDDSEMQPEDEEEMEHYDSMAAAIMAKHKMMEQDSGSPDEDEAERMADGGILSHDSIYSDDSDQADVSRNADEDANEEDQLSYNALRKENYSESEGLRQLDSPMDSNEHSDAIDSDAHDMVSQIRRKMKSNPKFR